MTPSYKTIVRADRFAEMKRRTQGYAEELVNTHTRGAIAQMKELVPVRTGALRDSIEMITLLKREGFGLTNGIQIGMYYWVFVNYGTVHMEARPFVEPALVQAFEALMRDVENIERALNG